MNSNLFYPLVIVCLVTHIIRTIYEILKHKKLFTPSGTSFAIIFTNMMLLWISWFGLCSLDSYTIELISIIKYGGGLISIIGVGLFVIALLTIKSLESYDGNLITKGIYSKIRHPMYLGFICWLIGVPLFFGAVFSLFLSFLFIANVLFWRNLEEIELEERFTTYKEYRKTTYF